MADTVSELYRMVALPDPPEDPLAFTKERVIAIREALNQLEAAASSGTSDDLDADVYEAAEQVRAEAERLNFGLESWDADH